MRSNKIQIELTDDDTATVTVVDESGKAIKKSVSVADLSSCLIREASGDETELTPPGLLKSWKNTNYEIYWMYFPAQTITVGHTSRSHGSHITYIPQTVMQYTFKVDMSGRRKFLYHVSGFTIADEDILTPNTKMYAFPFNNYSIGYNSGICWGDNTETIKRIFGETYDIDVFKLSSLHRVFFSTPFNEHLGGSGYPSQSLIRTTCSNSGVSINENLLDKNGCVYEYLRQIAASETLEYEPAKIFSHNNGVIFDSLNSMIAAGITTFKNR